MAIQLFQPESQIICLITRLRQSGGQQLKSTKQIALLPVQYYPSIGPGIVSNDLALCLVFNLKSRWRPIQVFVRRCFCYWPSIRQKKASNHSVRKTSIGRLFNGIFPENYVSVSGHKNSNFVLTNRRACFSHQRQMSMHSAKETSPKLEPPVI